MTKQNITIWIGNDDKKSGIGGKMADLEELQEYFKANNKISLGWDTIDDILKDSNGIFFLDVMKGNKTIKSIQLDLNMFRKKRKIWW